VKLRYLLDTNILSEPLRPDPNPQILEHLQRYEAEIAIASVVWHEMLLGAFRLRSSARRSAIEAYLTDVIAPTVPILPYDSQAAHWHATERVRLVSLGQTPSFADGQIAAIARVNQLVLITSNVADFSRFQDLLVETWTREARS
jgi:tRNA(fMet)-specific endonuclease VapC